MAESTGDLPSGRPRPERIPVPVQGLTDEVSVGYVRITQLSTPPLMGGLAGRRAGGLQLHS